MRIPYIDEIRGVAFALMILHHINYFKDVSTSYKTSFASHPIIDKIGTLSRTIFIILVGVGLYESFINKKEEEWSYEIKRFERSMVIIAHAIVISLTTYYFYPEYTIRFGVLHFIGVASLLCVPIVQFPIFVAILGIALYLFGDYIKFKTGFELIDLPLGLDFKYSMADYFPLIKWLPQVFFGIFLGYLLHNQDKYLFPSIFDFNIFEFIGKNALNLYTFHVVGLILYYEFTKV
jgi:uncharacterized membrane protein